MSVFDFEYPQPNSDYATELLSINKEVPENQNLYLEVICDWMCCFESLMHILFAVSLGDVKVGTCAD